MTSPRSLTFAAALALGAAALLLTGCGSSADPTPTTTVGTQTPTTAPTPGDPAATPEETPAASAEPVTCESLVVADTRDQFDAQGWTAKESPFVIDDVTLDGGMQCDWADYSVESGNFLTFAWAPITAEQATTAEDALQGQDWIREDGADGVYITEDPEQALTVDDENYGVTYLFGDGWVIMSDTKQQLLLIDRPQV